MSGTICLFSGPKHGQIIETELAGSPKIVFADFVFEGIPARDKGEDLPDPKDPKYCQHNSVYRRSRFNYRGRPVYIFDGMEL